MGLLFAKDLLTFLCLCNNAKSVLGFVIREISMWALLECSGFALFFHLLRLCRRFGFFGRDNKEAPRKSKAWDFEIFLVLSFRTCDIVQEMGRIKIKKNRKIGRAHV